MISQHILQQQRLNNNHERLLERHRRLLNPAISQFRTFGTSSLPGRNYDQYLNTVHGHPRRRDSLAAISRAGIGSSSETYRWMGDKVSEILPNNVSSVMQHSREQPMPLVHAEKFEPVKVYEHPIFGPTPAYLRPVYSERQHPEKTSDNDDESEDEADNDVRSHTSGDVSIKTDHVEEIKTPSAVVNDNDESSDNAPRGYISYKKWKTKYENLVPVNPLLFSIYTQRPNGSINSYGQSLYAKPDYLHRYRQSSRDGDLFTPTPSEIDSVSSETPHEPSLSSARRYHRLQPQLRPATITPRSLAPIRAESESDSSDDEASPPDSPVPYLSRNRPNPIIPASLSASIPSPSVTTPSISTIGIASRPVTTTLPTLDTSNVNSSGLNSTNTSTIPPAPPLPSSLLTTPSTTSSYQTPSNLPVSSPPIAPPMPSSLSITSSTVPYQTSSDLPVSSPPIAPPMPSSLSTTSSTVPYQTPSNLSVSSPPIAPPMPSSLSTTSSTVPYQTPSNLSVSSPPIAPPMPSSLSTTSSTVPYQTSSNLPVSSPPIAPPMPSYLSTATSTPLVAGPTKAVTFGASSSIPVTNDDISSSSDSSDDEKQKRRRRKKRQDAAGVGGVVDSSSSDD